DGAAPYELVLSPDRLLSTPMSGLADYFIEAIGDMEIRALVEHFGSNVDDTDPIMLAILYGENEVAYQKTVVNGETVIEMLPFYYEFNETKNLYEDGKHKEFTVVEGKYTATDGSYIAAYTGTEGYQLTCYDAQNNPVHYLKQVVGNPTRYEAYAGGVLVRHKPNILRPLLSGESGLTDTMESVYVADFFSVTASSDPSLISLSYGTEGVNYYINEAGEIVPITKPTKLGDLTNDRIDSVFDKIALADVVEIENDNALMRAIAYGKQKHYEYDEVENTVTMLPVRYKLNASSELVDFYYEDLKVENYVAFADGFIITDENGTKTYAVEGGEEGGVTYYNVYSVEGDYTETNLVYYRKTTILKMKGGIDDAINEVTINDLLDNDGSVSDDNVLLKSIGGWCINDLKDENNVLNLKLSEVIKIEDTDRPLNLLKDAKIGELSTEIRSMKLIDFLAEDIYLKKTAERMVGGETVEYFVDKNGNEIFYNKETLTWYTTSTFDEGTESAPVYLDKNNNELTYNAEEDKWYISGTTTESALEMTGCWYYMFTDPSGVKTPEDYTIDDMGLMTDNMTENVNKAVLKDLTKHGILGISETTLNTAVTVGFETDGVTPIKKLIGDLTASEALDVLAALESAGGGA
ncbi:MAG: hypothetical protein IJV80_02640, partial [Clostridia bacterium]|nr:hypothetical protein [Clostridia bacterium]